MIILMEFSFTPLREGWVRDYIFPLSKNGEHSNLDIKTREDAIFVNYFVMHWYIDVYYIHAHEVTSKK